MIVLADTGILLRLHDPADPNHLAVDAVVWSRRLRGNDLVIGVQNVAEFWNACTRPKTARGGWGLNITETERRLALIESNFRILTEPQSVYQEWRRLVVAHAVRGRQVHDARLVALMLVHGISHVLTLNPADFARYPGVTAVVP